METVVGDEVCLRVGDPVVGFIVVGRLVGDPVVGRCVVGRLVGNLVVGLCVVGRLVGNLVVGLCVVGRLVGNLVVGLCVVGRLVGTRVGNLVGLLVVGLLVGNRVAACAGRMQQSFNTATITSSAMTAKMNLPFSVIFIIGVFLSVAMFNEDDSQLGLLLLSEEVPSWTRSAGQQVNSKKKFLRNQEERTTSRTNSSSQETSTLGVCPLLSSKRSEKKHREEAQLVVWEVLQNSS